MSKKEKQRQKLIDLRSAIISKNHTLPFTVYSDETIEMLLNEQPTSISELAKIKGFPINGKRVTLFGKEIIKIFTDETVNMEEVADRISRELKTLSCF